MSTIYDMRTGRAITTGVQSQDVCNATYITARWLARSRRRSVVVEDEDARACYRVPPAGYIWRAPRGWAPPWGETGGTARDRSE